MPPTFLETLKREVARMQLAHPDREGELARAHALILHGMVSPSPDDPDTGQVLASDMQKVYHVNGTCDCDAGVHGRTCKHVHSWRLYQYVERKLAAQTAQEPAEVPCDSNRPQVHGYTQTPSALPESPVSITIKGALHGQDVMVTLRGTDFARVQAQAEAAVQWLDRPQPTPQASSSAPATGEGYCQKHGVQMRQTTKEGRSWYAHYDETAGRWCKGK
jgi:hypothetical protein